MFSERTVLKINPPTPADDAAEHEVLLGVCSVKVYQSKLPLAEHAGASNIDQTQTIVEIEISSDSSNSSSLCAEMKKQSPPQNECLGRDKNPTSFRFNQLCSQPVDQTLLRTIGGEVHRISQRLGADRPVDWFHERLQHLSARELDVLVLMIQGRSCKEVASKLEVGLATVAKHRARVFKKLSVKNPIELVHLLNTVFAEKLASGRANDDQPIRSQSDQHARCATEIFEPKPVEQACMM